MSIFDSLMGQAGNIDIASLAEKVGLNPDELKAGGESLLTKLASGDHDAESATVATAAETGLPADKLSALLPALSGALGNAGGEGGLTSMLGGLLGGAEGGEGGVGGALGGIAGKLGGLFGKN